MKILFTTFQDKKYFYLKGVVMDECDDKTRHPVVKWTLERGDTVWFRRSRKFQDGPSQSSFDITRVV